MKKIYLLALAVALLISLFAIPATAALSDGYVFDIHLYNNQIQGERGLLIDSNDNLANAGSWSVYVVLEKEEGDIYKVIADAKSSGGNTLAEDGISLKANQAILVVHSAYSSIDSYESAKEAGTAPAYQNINQKNDAAGLKKGDYLVINLPTKEAGEDLLLKTFGTAKYYATKPTGTGNDTSSSSTSTNTNSPSNSGSTTTTSGNGSASTSSKPQAGDNGSSFIVLSAIALISLAGGAIAFNRKRNSK